MFFLHQYLEEIKLLTPPKLQALQKDLSIFTIKDILEHYPFRYIDRSVVYSVRDLSEEMPFIQLKVQITGIKTIGDGRAKRLVAEAKDQTGTLELVWFQGIQWIQKGIAIGKEYLVFGKPTKYGRTYNIAHPEMELLQADKPLSKVGFLPVYSSTENLRKKGLDTKGIQKLIEQIFKKLHPSALQEFLPIAVLKGNKLLSHAEALQQIHFPTNYPLVLQAQTRLKFEEVFFVQLALLKIKANRNLVEKGFLFPSIEGQFNDFYNHHLPFELTNAQKRVLKEIRKDTLSGKQMNRLVQGDVGSGKTIVALMSMLMALNNGFQACLMAPTEILAQQHYEGIQQLLENTDITCALLTGSTTAKNKRILLEKILDGEIDILIGTHALIEPTVVFKNLGIAVIDEQHRFGVAQRAALWKKNVLPPHVLVMTATPIPRTLAMTLYGDLDYSVIDELPPGRKPIHTAHKLDSERLAVYGFMRHEIEKGRQIYVVYPLIEESETLDYKTLTDGFESLSREFPQPQYQIAMVHGRMSSAEKEAEMQRFVSGIAQILVATTVIEVGVNVPNASVMVVESAERFGLSQLHQLRGRVGRGAEQSYCILMTKDTAGYDSRKRIKILCETSDGFRIADEDLKLRGPGDIQGTRQSGTLEMKLTNLATDQDIVVMARNVAFSILEKDAALNLPEHEPLKKYLIQHKKHQSEWGKIS